MPATVIVGLQWGDEGKGKTTDFLAEQVAVVVRYQGGDNAGHTVVVGEETVKLQLCPSGVLYPHITPVIRWNPAEQAWETTCRGYSVLSDPWLNKGTAFTEPERAALGLTGLLPSRVLNLDQQAERAYRQCSQQASDLDKTGHVRLLTSEEAGAGSATPAVDAAVGAPVAEAEPDVPLPNYDELSVASLRARLRNLDAAQVKLLAAYERAHAARADVITMFERRLAKLEAGD